MQRLFLLVIGLGSFGLTSCSLLQSAAGLPIRTLQTLGRTTGLGIEQAEKVGGDVENAPIFEVVSEE